MKTYKANMLIISLFRYFVGKVKSESKSSKISKKLIRRLLSCDLFILLFDESYAGGPVHLKINLISTNSFNGEAMI